MSCLSVTTRMLNKPPIFSVEKIGGISASASLVGNPIKISIFDTISHLKVRLRLIPNLTVNITPKKEFFVNIFRGSEELKVGFERFGEPLSVAIDNASTPLKVRCSIVCSLKELRNYLFVSPEEVQWITQEYGIVYDVFSDADWIILTS